MIKLTGPTPFEVCTLNVVVTKFGYQVEYWYYCDICIIEIFRSADVGSLKTQYMGSGCYWSRQARRAKFSRNYEASRRSSWISDFGTSSVSYV